jgi:hypothetical protein
MLAATATTVGARVGSSCTTSGTQLTMSAWCMTCSSAIAVEPSAPHRNAQAARNHSCEWCRRCSDFRCRATCRLKPQAEALGPTEPSVFQITAMARAYSVRPMLVATDLPKRLYSAVAQANCIRDCCLMLLLLCGTLQLPPLRCCTGVRTRLHNNGPEGHRQDTIRQTPFATQNIIKLTSQADQIISPWFVKKLQVLRIRSKALICLSLCSTVRKGLSRSPVLGTISGCRPSSNQKESRSPLHCAT